MRFAQVIGILHREPTGYRFVVTLDNRTSVRTVRDEPVAALMRLDGIEDPEWTVDQLTQETIGTILAEQGWEVVARQEQAQTEDWAPPVASYLVRG